MSSSLLTPDEESESAVVVPGLPAAAVPVQGADETAADKQKEEEEVEKYRVGIILVYIRRHKKCKATKEFQKHF
jgi:hypothetical protein